MACVVTYHFTTFLGVVHYFIFSKNLESGDFKYTNAILEGTNNIIHSKSETQSQTPHREY